MEEKELKNFLQNEASSFAGTNFNMLQDYNRGYIEGRLSMINEVFWELGDFRFLEYRHGNLIDKSKE